MALVPKVPKIQRLKALNIDYSTLHCRLTPSVQGTPRMSTQNLPCEKLRVIGVHLRRRLCGSIFIQIFVVGSERPMFCAVRANGRSRIKS